VIIEPGNYTHLHAHEDTEQLYYVISGRGQAVFNYPDGRKEEFGMQPEDVVYVPRNTKHQIFCDQEKALMVFLWESPRGSLPGTITTEQSWSYRVNNREVAQALLAGAGLAHIF